MELVYRIEDEFLKSAAAARYLGIAKSTIIKWADAGKVPCYRTLTRYRMFRVSDLDALVRGDSEVKAAVKDSVVDRLDEAK